MWYHGFENLVLMTRSLDVRYLHIDKFGHGERSITVFSSIDTISCLLQTSGRRTVVTLALVTEVSQRDTRTIFSFSRTLDYRRRSSTEMSSRTS